MTMAPEPCVCRGPLARIYRSCPQHGEVGHEFFALQDTNARLVAALEDARERLVEAWHESGDEETRPLHDYLGMTWDEYARWVENGTARPESADTQPEHERAQAITEGSRAALGVLGGAGERPIPVGLVEDAHAAGCEALAILENDGDTITAERLVRDAVGWLRAALAGRPETVCPECGKRYTHLRLGETCSACDFAVKVVREGDRRDD